MNETPSTPVRRKPYQRAVEHGRSWGSNGIAYLYLDDLKYIHAVMSDYTRERPLYKRLVRAHRQRVQELEDALQEGKDAGTTAQLLGQEPDLAAPALAEIHVDDYIPVSIDELLSLGLKGASDIEMRTSTYEIELRCRPDTVRLITTQDDDDSIDAFEQIRQRLAKRDRHGVALFEGVPVLVVFAGLVFGVFAERAIGATATVVSLVVIALGLAMMLWVFLVWKRRKVAVFDYKENARKPLLENQFVVLVLFPLIVLVVGAIILRMLGLEPPPD